jgi:hypothetical protein
MPSALGACIEAEDAVVGPRPLARHGYLAAADQSYIGHRPSGGVRRARGDGGLRPGIVGDTVVSQGC